ncbi:hypothetical protein HN748_05030 [Candidatus Peregrinibacteria bacterium]|jgi:hypothetical protein|nr:hypothetical protein [Candidatus Peregrinibacteria bacterium]MBT7483935.1 hypothetical protein [Candidatus Peregrinibacteria bacterium]MBT7703573.1 hypothetical protein [Candidatus Peregrinibacteria bacterium]
MDTSSKKSKHSLKDDLIGVIKRDRAAMGRVAKNHDYFKIGLAIYALVQSATVFNQWLSLRAANRLMETLGVTPNAFGALDMLKEGLFGFVMGLLLMAIIYYMATKLFKGKEEIDLKGFMTLYCFIISPMALLFIPLVGFLALIWVMILFFVMMDFVFGFGVLKTIIVCIVSLLLWAIAAGPLGTALGVNAGFSTDFSLEL